MCRGDARSARSGGDTPIAVRHRVLAIRPFQTPHDEMYPVDVLNVIHELRLLTGPGGVNRFLIHPDQRLNSKPQGLGTRHKIFKHGRGQTGFPG